jgi:uncharacterized protein YdiU (UPF0061 family)
MIVRRYLYDAGWNFDNSYARLSESFYRLQDPTPVKAPKLVILNQSVAEQLGLNIQELQKDDGIAVFAGNLIPDGVNTIAQAYAGHQFGHFTMLGDGRAVLIGEQITPNHNRMDIQLKGSGITPYSRRGDGRAALGPMLREYIISEAMYGLGIPTTRSLAVVTTGEDIYRETLLPGAILTRVAASHIRVGTFQYAAKWCSKDELKELADYTIQRHYPHIAERDNPYLSFLEEVVKSQAMLIAKWQLVGFIHGVMNTDNMTISGETIDYGPCAFMDIYDPATVFSSIDYQGRYAYGNQPVIGEWNLARLAETLLPLLDKNREQAIKLAENTISEFHNIFHKHWLKGMREKLGLFNEEQGDEELISELLNNLKNDQSDYTNTFISLTNDDLEDNSMFKTKKLQDWYNAWIKRISRQEESIESIKELMRKNNPAVIPRNHRVEEALEAAVDHGDYSVMERLLNVLKNPYAYSLEQKEYEKLPEKASCPYRTFCGT